MKTLQSSCSNKTNYRNFIGNSSVFHNFHLNKPGICCLPLGKITKARYLCLISVRQKASLPVRCSSLVPNSKVELDAAETQLPNTYQLKTVHVKFQLQKECSFGEHFFMVGDDPMVGLWDPNCALPLNWSDGHIWSIELEIPVGKSINFKFILKRIDESLLWQPGPDRTFQTWETVNTITVLEDWESASYQKVTEEAVFLEQDEELKDDKKNEVLVENLMDEDASYRMNQGADINHYLYQEKMLVQAKSYNVAPNGNSPLLENPKPIVADNIILPTEDSLANQNDMVGEERMRSTNDVPVVSSSQGMLVDDTIVESNSGALSATDHTIKKADSVLIIHEEDPVLVPGLAPSSTVPTRETTLATDHTIKKADSILIIHEEDPVLVPGLAPYSTVPTRGTTLEAHDTDDPSRVSEAKNHNSPELDEKQESNVDAVQEIFAEMPTGGGQEVLGNVDYMSNHKPLKVIKEQEDSEPSQSDLLQNDIQWGRGMLQKLLNNLGIL